MTKLKYYFANRHQGKIAFMFFALLYFLTFQLHPVVMEPEKYLAEENVVFMLLMMSREAWFYLIPSHYHQHIIQIYVILLVSLHTEIFWQNSMLITF